MVYVTVDTSLFLLNLCAQRVFLFFTGLTLKLQGLLFNLEFMASDQCFFTFHIIHSQIKLNGGYNVNVL